MRLPGRAVDVGGPRPRPQKDDFPRVLAARRTELKALVDTLVARGILGAEERLVRELRAAAER